MTAPGGFLRKDMVWVALPPNGGPADLVWSRISPRLLPFPGWLDKGRISQGTFFAVMIGYSGWIAWLFNIHRGLPVAYPYYAAHGLLFLRFRQADPALAAPMILVFEPRPFRIYVCPGRTLRIETSGLNREK
ncbi:MAG: hypothetical protein STSR0007_10890 [Thermovirga sp.]